jgi:hypothetical protein
LTVCVGISCDQITEQPERQFTSGFMYVKARGTSFVINKFVCQNSKFQNFAEHLNFRLGRWSGLGPGLCHHFSQHPPRVLGRNLVCLAARGLGFISPSISRTFQHPGGRARAEWPHPRDGGSRGYGALGHHGGWRDGRWCVMMVVLSPG